MDWDKFVVKVGKGRSHVEKQQAEQFAQQQKQTISWKRPRR